MSKPFELQLQLAAINLDGMVEEHGTFPKEHNEPHAWSEQQKKFLCVLNRWFVCQKDGAIGEIRGRDLHDIFCLVYRSYLPASPRGRIISIGAVKSQLAQIRRDGRKSRPWRHVYQDTKFNDPFARWLKELIDIYQAGLHLGLDLLPRARDNVTAAAREPLRLVFDQKLSTLSNIDTSMDHDLVTQSSQAGSQTVAVVIPSPSHHQDHTEKPRSNNKSARKVITASDSASVSPEDILREMQPKGQGRLGFRYYHDDTHGIRNRGQGFRALAFAAAPIPHIETNLASLGSLAFLHLRPVLQPTHFISLFKNFRPAFRKALRPLSNARVAVVSLDYLNDHPIKGLPSLFEAGSIAKKFGIKGYHHGHQREYNYSYESEYIVWGKIDEEAIVADFAISDFDSLLEQRYALGKILSVSIFREFESSDDCFNALEKTKIRESDPETGKEVGNFLAFTGLPGSFVKDVALQIARMWRFVRITSHGSGAAEVHRQYLEYVEEGFKEFTQANGSISTQNTTEGTALNMGLHLPKRQPGSPDTLIEDDLSEPDALDLEDEPSILDTPSKIMTPSKPTDLSQYIYGRGSDDTQGNSPKRTGNEINSSPTKRRCQMLTPPPTRSASRKRINGRKTNVKAQRSTSKKKTKHSSPDHDHSQKNAPKLKATTKRSTKPPSSLTFDFSLLLRNPPQPNPVVIDDTPPHSDFDAPSSFSAEPASPSPKNKSTTQRRSHPPTEPVAMTFEVDNFMIRRLEINETLGDSAETRPEEWRGWKEDWKARGVI